MGLLWWVFIRAFVHFARVGYASTSINNQRLEGPGLLYTYFPALHRRRNNTTSTRAHYQADSTVCRPIHRSIERQKFHYHAANRAGLAIGICGALFAHMSFRYHGKSANPTGSRPCCRHGRTPIWEAVRHATTASPPR